MANGITGPIPKRSDERIRRNKDEFPVERLPVAGPVEVPDLDIPNAHPLVRDFYESLKDSGQSQYYEPSDWQAARLVCHFMNRLVKSTRPNGQMLATLSSMMTELMVTEGARRRLRLEIERTPNGPAAEEGQVISLSDRLKELMAQ